MLSEAGNHYGEGIIKEYSKKLTIDLGKGYTISALKRMRQFYLIIKKGATLSHQLSWSHYQELIPLNNINEINFYIKKTNQQNLSIRQLRLKIKSNEYERLPDETKRKFIDQQKDDVVDLVKNPIMIKGNKNYEAFSEKVLQKLILEDIENFLDELGNGFTFIKSEYPIKMGNKYNYIDLLLYNIKYKCYVVIELKVTRLKAEHIGQIQKYMNWIDVNLKTFEEKRTVGIIICKQDDKYIIEYCSDDRIIAREYELFS